MQTRTFELIIVSFWPKAAVYDVSPRGIPSLQVNIILMQRPSDSGIVNVLQ